MIFQQLFDPLSSTFTYVIARRAGAEAIIIDPVFEQVQTYLSLFERLNLRLVKAIDTHIHADHVTGLGALRDHTRCITVMGEQSGADVVSMRVREGDVIGVDGLKLDVLYTPGHTDDSYSFVMADRVFTGDTLLIEGTGRTDFQNGDPLAAYDSIFNKLLRLKDETLVFPAHDYRGNTVSTIASERARNPRLQVASAAEYAAIMDNLKLPNPKMMDVAVPANRSIGLAQSQWVAAQEMLRAEDAVASEGLVFVDLREPGERARDGYLPGSVHLPYTRLEEVMGAGGALRASLLTAPGATVLYCAFGERSAMALERLREGGVLGLRHLVGGLAAWIKAGGEVER
ncbi:MAG: MBL fold metallo-hydrolase [Bradymonadaceae bacterium]|nr:MBL fold metallo-hydrolase [Lujinxingiaceae bacterium]